MTHCEAIGATTDGATVVFENAGTAKQVFDLFKEFQSRTEGNFEGWGLDAGTLQLVDDTVFFEAWATTEATLERKLEEVLEFFKTCGGCVEFRADIALSVTTDNTVYWQPKE
jgi:hypothetical protein